MFGFSIQSPHFLRDVSDSPKWILFMFYRENDVSLNEHYVGYPCCVLWYLTTSILIFLSMLNGVVKCRQSVGISENWRWASLWLPPFITSYVSFSFAVPSLLVFFRSFSFFLYFNFLISLFYIYFLPLSFFPSFSFFFIFSLPSPISYFNFFLSFLDYCALSHLLI